MKMKTIRTYSELIKLQTFEERFRYLQLNGRVGEETFGFDPIDKEDILRRSDFLLNPEYLICTIKATHDAIHYGDESKLIIMPPERRPNDTCPWRR